MRKCCSCKQLKEVTEFHKNRSTKDGYQRACKVCILKFNQRKPKRENGHFNLHGATDEDYINMYLFLHSLGYDIFGNIAKQFADKYGLKYKQRRSMIVKNDKGPEILEKLKRDNLLSDQ